ncbi:DinB family protein [Streptomyces sp. NBC_00442]
MPRRPAVDRGPGGQRGRGGAGLADVRSRLAGPAGCRARTPAGLSDDRLHTPVEPLGWSPLDLVQHLSRVEHRRLRWGFGAEDVIAYPPGGDAQEWTPLDGKECAPEHSIPFPQHGRSTP